MKFHNETKRRFIKAMQTKLDFKKQFNNSGIIVNVINLLHNHLMVIV